MPWLVLEMLGEHFGLAFREGKRQPRTISKSRANRSDRRARHLGCDRLEERTLLTVTPGTDYVLYGTSWPNPGHITYSIAPDGVYWDHGVNSLTASFNTKFGTSGSWERQIALALATWNRSRISRSCRLPMGRMTSTRLAGSGDPRFGDIRVGGYTFPDTSSPSRRPLFLLPRVQPPREMSSSTRE